MLNLESLNLNTETLNVSSAKAPEFAGATEFIDATDLEEVSGKKSGNWLLSFLKEHLVLSITAGVILLLGIILSLLYHKGAKVKDEMKTLMFGLQIYNNYGSNVYKRVYDNTNSGRVCLNRGVYIDDFAAKVIVLTNIYKEAENRLLSSSENLQDLQLLMLAAARELIYISSEVMSATRHVFFRNRILSLSSNERKNIRAVWKKFGMDADSIFDDDLYCKYLVQAIVIELDSGEFTLSNNLQGLNNRVKKSSVRIGILKNLDPLGSLDIGKDFIYQPRFPTIDDVPMCDIRLGWNAFFRFGNEPFGFDEHRIYSLRLIRNRIIDLLSLEDFPRTVSQNDRELLKILLVQCQTRSNFLLSNNDYLQLSPEIKLKFENYVDNSNGSLSFDEFIEYCRRNGITDITSQMESNITDRLVDTIVDAKLIRLNLSDAIQDNGYTLDSNLKTLLLNVSLREQLNFDPDDCEEIAALFPKNNLVPAQL